MFLPLLRGRSFGGVPWFLIFFRRLLRLLVGYLLGPVWVWLALVRSLRWVWFVSLWLLFLGVWWWCLVVLLGLIRLLLLLLVLVVFRFLFCRVIGGCLLVVVV